MTKPFKIYSTLHFILL